MGRRLARCACQMAIEQDTIGGVVHRLIGSCVEVDDPQTAVPMRGAADAPDLLPVRSPVRQQLAGRAQPSVGDAPAVERDLPSYAAHIVTPA